MVLVEQTDAMLNFIEKHPELLASTMAKTKEGRSMCKKYWTACAGILNSISTDCTQKTPDEWRMYYNEFKFKTLRRVKSQKSIQSGQPGKMLVLTNAQKRLYKLLGNLPSSTCDKTELKLSNTSDKIMSSSQSLEQEMRNNALAQDSGVTVTIENSVDDPLLGVKQETHWTAQDDSRSRDSDTDGDSFFPAARIESLGPTAQPSKPEIPVNMDFTLKKGQDHRLVERSIERTEELHKLKVAEKIWLLKTMRERHATARLERERAQIERDRARLERDHAQHCRDKTQLELDRAKRDDTNYNT